MKLSKQKVADSLNNLEKIQMKSIPLPGDYFSTKTNDILIRNIIDILGSLNSQIMTVNSSNIHCMLNGQIVRIQFFISEMNADQIIIRYNKQELKAGNIDNIEKNILKNL
jgi:hypothetical protein